MEKYFTQEYKDHLKKLELAEVAFKANPNKLTATTFSDLKYNQFKGEFLTEEGLQIKRESQERSRRESLDYLSTLIFGK